jgi:hypothetical protein
MSWLPWPRGASGSAIVDPSGFRRRAVGKTCARSVMDDLSSHFYTTVGQVLDQAALGGLHVRLELSDGSVVEGVPSGSRPFTDAELDDTGYPRHVRVDGQVIVLEWVREAAIIHPDSRDGSGRR